MPFATEDHRFLTTVIYYHDFLYKSSVTNRVIIKAFESINAAYNLERVHISMVKELAKGANGKRINLPNSVVAIKEYEYVTLIRKEKQVIAGEYPFKSGTTNFADITNIVVKKSKDMKVKANILLIDSKKLPKDAVWRTMRKGDAFTKFGGGSKALRSFMIDKKIPARVRQSLPVLASGSEVYCILGVEISDKVKVDSTTKVAYEISEKEIKGAKD